MQNWNKILEVKSARRTHSRNGKFSYRLSAARTKTKVNTGILVLNHYADAAVSVTHGRFVSTYHRERPAPVHQPHFPLMSGIDETSISEVSQEEVKQRPHSSATDEQLDPSTADVVEEKSEKVAESPKPHSDTESVEKTESNKGPQTAPGPEKAIEAPAAEDTRGRSESIWQKIRRLFLTGISRLRPGKKDSYALVIDSSVQKRSRNDERRLSTILPIEEGCQSLKSGGYVSAHNVHPDRI